MSFEYMDLEQSPLAFKIKNLPVFFTDKHCMEIIQIVLAEDGCIRNFPGIVEDERWIKKRRVGTCPDVRYEAGFYSIDNSRYLMLWLIQPNGWYWVDEDGFGFTGDSSIMLYTIIDEKGNFLKEFELFSIDRTRYCHEFDEYVGT